MDETASPRDEAPQMTAQRHTGAQFEAGEVHRAHGVNDPEAAAMRDRMFADADSPAGIGIQSPQGAAAAATAHEDSPRRCRSS